MLFNSVGKIKSEQTFEVLQNLQWQIPSLRAHAAELMIAVDGGNLESAVHATENTRRLLDAIALSADILRRIVIPEDGLGGSCGSLGELALRATRLLMIDQIPRLREALSHVGSRRPPVDARGDMVAFIQAELLRITAIWVPYRASFGEQTCANGQRALYRAAIREAQQAFRALGVHQEFSSFLASGAARTDLPSLARHCRRIQALIGIYIDAEPDQRLLTHFRPLHSEELGHAGPSM